MILKEELLDNLLTFLQDVLNREPSSYKFLMKNSEEGLENYSYLDQFLDEEFIPSTALGVNLMSRTIIPSMSHVETDQGRMPTGLYVIQPETNEEVILYLYHNADQGYRKEPRCIAGYRSGKAFEEFFVRYRCFCSKKERKRNTISVFRGRDIEKPNLSWDDLVLDPTLKADIKWHVESFMAGEDLYKRLGVPYKRGFLFTGPPGNGKTMLLKVIASNSPKWKGLYFVMPPACDNDDVDQVFRQARELSPSILCFEDIDTLFNGHVTLSHFLNKLDGFELMDGMLIMATTNHPELIDTALTSRPSRFDRVWIIDNPEKETRRLFLERQTAFLKNDGLAETVAMRTEGFSMAYLKELCLCASMLAIDRGLGYPGEKEILDSLEAISVQTSEAKHRFTPKVRPIGFAVR